MRVCLVACLLAAASADQTASAGGDYGTSAPASGYQGGATRPQGGARRIVQGGAHGGAQGGYKVSAGGFKTPVGTADYGLEEYQYRPSPYAFDYAVSNVETGAEYAANENSDGTQTTGFYTVALPDGRIQTVKYTVDESGGFNAEVSYEGEATYPEPSEYAGPGGRKQGPSSGYKPVVKSSPAYRSEPVFRSDAAPSYSAAKAAAKYAE